MTQTSGFSRPDGIRYVKAPQAADTSEQSSISDSVATIIEAVATEGDAAVRRFGLQFDKADLETTEVTEQEIEQAFAQFDPQSLADSRFAIEQVTNFAEQQLATMKPLEIETLPGVHLGHRILPIRTVGCYVPGGRYPLYSAPIMSIVPAGSSRSSWKLSCSVKSSAGRAGETSRWRGSS